ncbi:hypothetical protein J0H58_21955 [bacterium]|nr:hypothetical protein [bacterium]
MTEHELRRVPPFGHLPILFDTGQPHKTQYTGVIYEAVEPEVVRDLLADRQLVPRGMIPDAEGQVTAVFWQHRPEEPL